MEPSVLLDPDVLSREIWEYYIETLRTDGHIEKTDRTWDWDEMGEISKRNFIEAVTLHVCRRVEKMSERQTVVLDESRAKRHTLQADAMCYMCGVNPAVRVDFQSGIAFCGRCK